MYEVEDGDEEYGDDGYYEDEPDSETLRSSSSKQHGGVNYQKSAKNLKSEKLSRFKKRGSENK